MVNYKRVVCELVAVVALAALAAGAPAPVADCAERRHYDQRQNGTENYRLNIDGVVIAVAPAESLLSAASEIDFGDLLDLEEFTEPQKPKPPSNEASPQMPLDPKPQGSPAAAQDSKPGTPTKPAESPLSDVSLNSEVKSQRKEAINKKQEKAQRLKHRLANILLPLLRRTRHH